MTKRAGPLAEISLEFAEIIYVGSRDENISIWTRQPAYWDVKHVLPFNLTLYICSVNKY